MKSPSSSTCLGWWLVGGWWLKDKKENSKFIMS